MKHLKMLAMVATAAIAGIAFTGASSASATSLYSGATTLGTGTVIDMSMTGSSIDESGSTVLDTCTGGTIKGTIQNSGGVGKSVSLVVNELIWKECSKTTDTLNLGSLEIHWIEGTKNGTLTGSDAEWTSNTIFGTCVYGTAKALNIGTIMGSTTGSATINISTSVPKISGNFACPSTTLWTASYAFTSPSPLHVTGS